MFPQRLQLIVGLLVIGWAVVPQSPPPLSPPATVSGRVVDGNGAGVPNAVVSLCRNPKISVRSQADGDFVLADVAVRDALLCVQQPREYYLIRTEPSLLIGGLKAGEVRSGVRFRVRQYGSLGGTVLNHKRAPLGGVTVRLVRQKPGGDYPSLLAVAATKTDDAGRFSFRVTLGSYGVMVPMTRLSIPVQLTSAGSQLDPVVIQRLKTLAGAATTEDLVLGETWSGFTDVHARLVGALSAPGHAVAMVSHPTPMSRHSTFLVISEGTRKEDLELVLSSGPASRITGQLVLAEKLPPDIPVLLESVAPDNASSPVITAISYSDSNARFAFIDVPEGTYKIKVDGMLGEAVARVQYAATDGLWGQTHVFHTSQLQGDIEIPLHRTVAINGSIRFIGDDSPVPAPEHVRLMLSRLDNETELGMITPNSELQFQTQGLSPGRYLLKTPSVPSGWYLLSAIVDRVDISSEPLVIVDRPMPDVSAVVSFTRRPTSIRGRVYDIAGEPAAGLFVVACAKANQGCTDSPSNRRVSRVRVGPDGQYEFVGLAAGQYWIAVIGREEIPDDWPPSVDWLRAVPRAGNSVELTESTVTTRDIRLARVIR